VLSLNRHTGSQPMPSPSSRRCLGAMLALLAVCTTCRAQELEPRRWSHLPIGSNFAGLAYAYSEGDIAFDPVLQIEDGTFDLHTIAFKFVRSFELFGKSARFDLTQAYQDGSWEGRLEGAPAAVDRRGFTDTALRFAINLFGAPPLAGREFAEYRAGVADCETIVGAGLVVVLPTGYYRKDRLINLGGNRFTFRPQFGIVHQRGPWSFELSAAGWLRTDNDSFWNGNELENDPLFALQGHLIYTIRPGLWLGASAGYGFGGRSEVDDREKNDRRSQVSWALSLGIPINRQLGLKLAYVGSRSLERVGSDKDTIAVAASVLW
jgi:hypothetical protein